MTDTNDRMHPPRWAENVLLLLVDARRGEDISGDLLEEYREAIRPERGRLAADLWYVGQVLRFLWRRIWIWSVAFSFSFIVRTAWDWFAPTHDFHLRSTLSTVTGAAILFVAAFVAASRARSTSAGALAAMATVALAAVASATGVAALLAFRHDAQTWSAIQASGGLSEAFELPFMMLIPAIILGSAGGITGKLFVRSHEAA